MKGSKIVGLQKKLREATAVNLEANRESFIEQRNLYRNPWTTPSAKITNYLLLSPGIMSVTVGEVLSGIFCFRDMGMESILFITFQVRNFTNLTVLINTSVPQNNHESSTISQARRHRKDAR